MGKWKFHLISHLFVAPEVGESPLVLVYPRELLTSYWAGGMRGMSSMLDTGPRLSSEAKLRCSSGPPERIGGDAPMNVLTSTEPQLFLPLNSLSRPVLKDNHYFSEDLQSSKVYPLCMQSNTWSWCFSESVKDQVIWTPEHHGHRSPPV